MCYNRFGIHDFLQTFDGPKLFRQIFKCTIAIKKRFPSTRCDKINFHAVYDAARLRTYSMLRPFGCRYFSICAYGSGLEFSFPASGQRQRCAAAAVVTGSRATISTYHFHSVIFHVHCFECSGSVSWTHKRVFFLSTRPALCLNFNGPTMNPFRRAACNKRPIKGERLMDGKVVKKKTIWSTSLVFSSF